MKKSERFSVAIATVLESERIPVDVKQEVLETLYDSKNTAECVERCDASTSKEDET